jgi:hypothetical protein
MARRSKVPQPSNVRRYSGGPWAGREDWGTSAPPPLLVEVPTDGNTPSPGRYKCNGQQTPIPNENAVAWKYDWETREVDDSPVT